MIVKIAALQQAMIKLSFNDMEVNMTEMTAVQKDKLMSDLRVVISDAEELLRMTADEAGEGAADLRGRVQARMNQAKIELIHLQEAAVAKVKAAGHATDEFVHENPWKSIGIAAGLGLVVGLLVIRR
jgi:ElaB/YqjD/DUF883 family membrane-anchored ribosome-binding protein